MLYTEREGIVFDIQRYSLHDGPGIRTVVFLKGCPLRCKWCCNPESWKKEPQLSYLPARCIGCGACESTCPQGAIHREGDSIRFDQSLCTSCGSCVAECYPQARLMSGKKMNTAQVMDQVMKDWKYYERTGGGITLSGGEMALQWAFAEALLAHAKERHLHTAVETTGYAPWEHLEKIFRYTDLVLYDLKHMDSALHKKYTGVENERILENLRRAADMGKEIIIRIPLIPGCNDDTGNLQATAEYIAGLKKIQEVHLLPYHMLGVSKYPMMGYAYTMKETVPPETEQVHAAAEVFISRGFSTQIHG